MQGGASRPCERQLPSSPTVSLSLSEGLADPLSLYPELNYGRYLAAVGSVSESSPRDPTFKTTTDSDHSLKSNKTTRSILPQARFSTTKTTNLPCSTWVTFRPASSTNFATVSLLNLSFGYHDFENAHEPPSAFE